MIIIQFIGIFFKVRGPSTHGHTHSRGDAPHFHTLVNVIPLDSFFPPPPATAVGLSGVCTPSSPSPAAAASLSVLTPSPLQLQTVPLTWGEWLVCIAVGFGTCLISWATRWVSRNMTISGDVLALRKIEPRKTSSGRSASGRHLTGSMRGAGAGSLRASGSIKVTREHHSAEHHSGGIRVTKEHHSAEHHHTVVMTNGAATNNKVVPFVSDHE